MATSRFSLTLFWPTYSTSFLGRRDSSNCPSSSVMVAPTTRFSTLFLRQYLKRSLEQYIKARVLIAVRCATYGALGNRSGVAKVFESGQHIGLDCRLRRLDAEVLQFVFEL